jgi:squalene synthase HpnC
VAPRLLPGAVRRDLRAIYDVARSLDDIGDDATGSTAQQRLIVLDAFEAELRLAWTDGGRPHHPAVARLASTVHRRRLTFEPFHLLVEANRMDQRVSSYATWEDLRAYCALSAEPVGRIVLDVFGAAGPQQVAFSDDVCTALQLLEHCQDVGEDRRNGRTYLPAQTLAQCGAEPADLDAGVTSGPVRRAVAREVARAEEMLRCSGPPLVRSLCGPARLTIAGFIGGGLATAKALRRAQFDVLRFTPRPAKRDTLRHAGQLTLSRAVGQP